MPVVTYGHRAKETSTTTGTGTLTLLGAETGHQTLVAAAGDGAYVPYTIVGISGAAEGEWETGYGTVTDAASDTLSRTVVSDSSNSGSLVNFSAGTKEVFISAHATELAKSVIVVEAQEPSAASEVDFDISGYESVKLIGWARPASDADFLRLRVSDDGGSTFKSGSSDYQYSRRWSTAGSQGYSGSEAATFIDIGGSVGNTSPESISFEITINSPANSSCRTAIHQNGHWHNSGDTTSGTGNGSGSYNTAAATDAVRLYFGSGNIASGRIVMYGYPSP